MQSIPTISKAREKNQGNNKMTYNIENVDGKLIVKRFTMIQHDLLLPMANLSYTDASIKFASSKDADFCFSMDLRARDRVDSAYAPSMMTFIIYAHFRKLVLGKIDPFSIIMPISPLLPKFIGLSSSMLCYTDTLDYQGELSLYHAPEVIHGRKISQKSDVYGFALWWVTTASGDFVENWNTSDVYEIRERALSLCKFNIQREMLSLDPMNRPRMSEVRMHYADENKQVEEHAWATGALYPTFQAIHNIFKSQSDALPALKTEEELKLVINAMPCIFAFYAREIPPQIGDGHWKHNVGVLLDFVIDLMVSKHNIWLNFDETDLGGIQHLLMAFHYIDQAKAFIVMHSMQTTCQHSFSSALVSDLLDRCSSMTELGLCIKLTDPEDACMRRMTRFYNMYAAETSAQGGLQKEIERLQAQVQSEHQSLLDYQASMEEMLEEHTTLLAELSDLKDQMAQSVETMGQKLNSSKESLAAKRKRD